jgi:hypothetical protein
MRHKRKHLSAEALATPNSVSKFLYVYFTMTSGPNSCSYPDSLGGKLFLWLLVLLLYGSPPPVAAAAAVTAADMPACAVSFQMTAAVVKDANYGLFN